MAETSTVSPQPSRAKQPGDRPDLIWWRPREAHLRLGLLAVGIAGLLARLLLAYRSRLD
jgi:hypothetical protein